MHGSEWHHQDLLAPKTNDLRQKLAMSVERMHFANTPETAAGHVGLEQHSDDLCHLAHIASQNRFVDGARVFVEIERQV